MAPYELEKFLADLAYKDPNERQSHLDRSVYKDHVKLHSGFNRDEFFSAEDSKGQKHYNVHRGSHTKEDWLTSDVELAQNNLKDTGRFRRASRMSFNASDRYASGKFSDGKKKEVVEVGHSLGGALAEHIALDQKRSSVVFNQGTTPLRDYKEIDRSKHVHVRTKEDAVSAFDNNDQTISVDSVHGNGVFPIGTLNTMFVGSDITQSIVGSIFGAVKGHSLDAFG